MDIKSAQAKGFGGDGGKQYTVENDITPLKNRVLVSDMHFGETKSKGGIIMVDDDGTAGGIHPRWGKVYAVGKDQVDVKVGEWVMVSHGRWSRAFKLNRKEKGTAGDIGVELEVRMIDENDILLVSQDEPEFNSKQAGYINMGGAQQMTKLPGND
jgi:co-chaperonin GroES (HSP10)